MVKNDFLENALSKEITEEKNNLDVLKELFNIMEIDAKTELSINQIILINQKRTIAKLLNFNELDDCLDNFCQLMLSNKRQSRKEFIDGFKSERENEIQKSQGGFFSGLRSKMNI